MLLSKNKFSSRSFVFGLVSIIFVFILMVSMNSHYLYYFPNGLDFFVILILPFIVFVISLVSIAYYKKSNKDKVANIGRMFSIISIFFVFVYMVWMYLLRSFF